jgi:hypothetical protein
MNKFNKAKIGSLLIHTPPRLEDYEAKLNRVLAALAENACDPLTAGVCDSCRMTDFLQPHFNHRSPDNGLNLCVRCKDYAERGDDIAEMVEREPEESDE